MYSLSIKDIQVEAYVHPEEIFSNGIATARLGQKQIADFQKDAAKLEAEMAAKEMAAREQAKVERARVAEAPVRESSFDFQAPMKFQSLTVRLFLTRMESSTGKEMNDLYTRMVGAQQAVHRAAFKQFIRVLKKCFLYFFKASWQKRGFAEMLKSLKRENRFNDLARHPGAHSLFFNRLL